MVKYGTITCAHAFMAVALETSNACGMEGLEFFAELENRILDITHDPSDTSYVFQWILLSLSNEEVPSAFVGLSFLEPP